MTAPARAVFYYDFNSPYAYLAAERISSLFAGAGAEQPEWRPISLAFVLRATGRTPWSMAPGGPNPDDLAEIRRRASERGMPEVKYPPGWPVSSYSLIPLRAAVYAGRSGRIISFSLAALRQAFAAGRPLTELDNVLIAAAACELHPRAVQIGIETESVKDRLQRDTDEAIAAGVPGVPTVKVGEDIFWGDDRLEEAVLAASG